MGRIAFLLFSILSLSGIIYAQSPGGQVFAARLCGTSDFSFPCPVGYEIKNALGKDSPYIAVETKNKITVFAYSPAKSLAEAELVAATLPKVFALLESPFDQLEKKESSDFSGDEKWSKFEVSKFAQAALDKTNDRAFHYQFVHLNVNGKQVIAGFVYNPVLRRETAVAWFQRWRGGGDGNATQALNSLVTSITKEAQRIAPGGPPPGATL